MGARRVRQAVAVIGLLCVLGPAAVGCRATGGGLLRASGAARAASSTDTGTAAEVVHPLLPASAHEVRQINGDDTPVFTFRYVPGDIASLENACIEAFEGGMPEEALPNMIDPAEGRYFLCMPDIENYGGVDAYVAEINDTEGFGYIRAVVFPRADGDCEN